MLTENVLSADNQQERLIKIDSIGKIPTNLAWYFAGFIDGEGSFNISLRKKPDYKLGWQPVLSFNVSQREKTVLEIMKKYFNCGIIKRRKDGLHSYDVTNPEALLRIIIPFFKKYEFLSQYKRKNFYIFEKAVKIMFEKQHLTEQGLNRLLNLREIINEGRGRTRKYTKIIVQKISKLESSETTRQDPI